MSTYRRGTILGLTVAETFILLAFLLLIALLLGLTKQDEQTNEPEVVSAPRVWERPERIEALINDAVRARAVAEQERDQLREQAEQARVAQREAEQARATAEQERDQAVLLHRKGNNPPCWYEIVPTSNGKTREKHHYAFDVAIYEHSIVLSPRPAPPGGAEDDGGESYAIERERLRIAELPYDIPLNDYEFKEAVTDLVTHGRNGRVRSYECVFSVMVWDKTPAHAKKRWKDVHDQIIEESFGAYTARDLEWKGVEPTDAGGATIQ